MTNCDILLRAVYETGFNVDDLKLYADTHPGCAEAAQALYNALLARNQAVAQYENACGALTLDHLACGQSWINTPWPWEGSV